MGEFQIGGGSGWVAARVAEAAVDLHACIDALRGAWHGETVERNNQIAQNAIADAVAHLEEALTVEAVEDAVEAMQRVLEALRSLTPRITALSEAQDDAEHKILADTLAPELAVLKIVENRLADPPPE
jgi:hypothetical protein